MGKKSRNSPAGDGGPSERERERDRERERERERGGFRISVFETWYTPLDGAAQLPSDVL